MNNEHHIEKLLIDIDKTVTLNTETERLLVPQLIINKIKKKSYVLEPGHIANTMNFIVKGCMRCFYIDDNGNEHILQLGIENWWINDLYSYLSQEPSRMFIQAIEDTTLVQIYKEELEKLYLESPTVSNFFRMKLQNAYVALQKRMMHKLSTDAYERYQIFIKDYRNIEQRIPQYMVASYLGITPEFLSHLRKKHSDDLS
ncbi:CRP-like cAMP-binding protein [Gelidibacter algens]|uniref:CRP-like cAMP-binding protein n=2 Tax=Gelidibacter algens TaxID=49280 RepID=A0A1A7QYQ7_9FLAO|nr:Crp/Fnr family transcriptional regulator [Gelidibacter algens]OBX25145.1 cyclic nucleotide-binding protein [Gelidibacter algens]RAJ20036.1 CRP-like cAMP-binding protein [Gelidibacter algens]